MLIAPTVWVEVGRLSRATFSAMQEALETQASVLGREAELPEAGDLYVDGHAAHYEIDAELRTLTLVAVRPEQ